MTTLKCGLAPTDIGKARQYLRVMDMVSTFERPFAVDRRGTTIQAGDIVLHRGQLRRVLEIETVGGPVVLLADAAGRTTSAPASQLQLVL